MIDNTMIRKLIIALVCLLPMFANAQTIHWLTFIDTTDPNVGKIDVNGREVLYNHFVNVVKKQIFKMYTELHYPHKNVRISLQI